MARAHALLGAALLGVTSMACTATGPHVHVASATPADLAAVENADSVWYEFRPGDEVPFQFMVFGDAISAGEPTKLIARKHFWIILHRNGPMQLSYDGKSASPDRMEFMLSIVPDESGKAKVVWLNHMGAGDPTEALNSLMGPESAGSPEGVVAPPGGVVEPPTNVEAETVSSAGE